MCTFVYARWCLCTYIYGDVYMWVYTCMYVYICIANAYCYLLALYHLMHAVYEKKLYIIFP